MWCAEHQLFKLVETLPAPSHLYDHLCHTLSTQGLAADKGLVLDGGQEVAKSSEHEKDGSSKQTSSLGNCAQPLDQTHDTVDAGARVVGRDLADRGIERG